MPYINGKIVQSDKIKRKSDQTVLEDPCEPKLLFYFNGPNRAEDFKKAIKLLEKEFADADLIGAPAGKRDQGRGKVEQWGPSFTNMRNRLMFYTQGGFTESGRDHAIREGKLSQLFEGTNYYLHKGSKDPLADLPSTTYSMDQFLQDLEKQVDLFDQPFHLIKLQNILNRLNQDPRPSKQIESWKGSLKTLIEKTASNMSLNRQRAMQKLLENWENMGDVNNAVAKEFYRDLGKNLEEIDTNRGVIKGKLTYISEKAQQKITLLKSAILDGSKTIPELKEMIPPSFFPLFIEQVKKDNPVRDIRYHLIDQFMEAFNAKALEKGIVLTEIEKQKIKEQVKEDTYLNDDFTLSYIHEHVGPRSYTFSGFLSSKSHKDSPNLLKLEKELTESGRSKEEEPKFTFDGKLNFKSGIELAIEKLTNVQLRQQERLQAAEKGEAVSIPQYFHTTNADAATSIAKTGIEALPAQSGFGAFFSTAPEFRYGHIAFGLPRTVEFDSERTTYLTNSTVPYLLNEKHIWVALKELINIHPHMMILRQNFSTAIQQAIAKTMEDVDTTALSLEQKIEFEERLALLLNRSIAFRATPPSDTDEERWTLNYRDLDKYSHLPQGRIHHIYSDKSKNNWVSRMIRMTLEKCKIKPSTVPNLNDTFNTEFAKHFKQHYYHAEDPRDDYSVKGHTKEKLRACVIAPDDEFRKHYKSDYDARNIKSKSSDFQTLSEVKKQFKEAGMDEDIIEFIPLSEMLIERDFLIAADAKVPQKW
ncbi:hypothetical protein [Candidatus Protochlamydia phocaeensis]|uniref:hypothetical protein n=1 Tax=Candidatus Protochlamydia phocaeensis TaxID=1414722 RepID=UPI0008380030|nr:hypothetical protein [Candidatus Protochlamydia phocaeensis]